MGGLYLCFEGFEKIWHRLAHREDNSQHKEKLHQSLVDPEVDLASFEQNKIKGAIRTDFVLSAEIIVIALGTVSDASLFKQAIVVSLITMTIGVYGFVALTVKLDDIGLYLLSDKNFSLNAKIKHVFGRSLLTFCPWLMKVLTLAGTAAMFLVGGGIITHGVAPIHNQVEAITHSLNNPSLVTLLFSLIVGLAAGSMSLFIFNFVVRGKVISSQYKNRI